VLTGTHALTNNSQTRVTEALDTSTMNK